MNRPLYLYVFFILLMVLLSFIFPEKSHTILNYLLVFFAWNMAVILHELGHVFLGKKNNLTVIEMTAMFIRIVKSKDRTIISENKDWTKVGGVVHFLPGDSTNNLTTRWKWSVLGGPIFSFSFGILFLLLSWMYPLFFINILGYMNIAIGVITVIPFAQSDSSIFLMLHRNDKNANEYILSLLLLQEFSSDKQPSQWSKEVVEQSRDLLSNDLNMANEKHSILRLPLYYYYFDVGNYSEALNVLKPISKVSQDVLMSDPQTNIMFNLYITHLCLFNRNHNYLQSLSQPSNIDLIGNKEPYSYYRTLAAYKTFQQDFNGAKEALKQAKDLLNQELKLSYGYAKVEKHLLEGIQEEILLENTI